MSNSKYVNGFVFIYTSLFNQIVKSNVHERNPQLNPYN